MNEETTLDFASVQAIITSESSIEGSNLHGAEVKLYDAFNDKFILNLSKAVVKRLGYTLFFAVKM